MEIFGYTFYVKRLILRNNLYNHSCHSCRKSYLSPEPDRFYCSSSCEARGKYLAAHPQGRRKQKQFVHPELKIKEVISESERWINKKSATERPKQDLRKIMYGDTFKKYIPKRLKVMRG